MRALLKQILKGSGTPVLQTQEGDEETILSAGNIWTSAHARRIELRDRGLVPGAVLCSEAGGFQAVVDFVACAIGGFVYHPVTPARRQALERQLANNPIASRTGIAFAGGAEALRHHPDRLPIRLALARGLGDAQLVLDREQTGPSVFTASALEAWLDHLSAAWGTPEGGARLSYGLAHHDLGFVTDLLLGIRNRQTIYLRDGARTAPSDMLAEILDLSVEDLVIAPAMLDDLCREARQLGPACRSALRRVRCQLAGTTISARDVEQALQLFDQILEPVSAQAIDTSTGGTAISHRLSPAREKAPFRRPRHERPASAA